MQRKGKKEDAGVQRGEGLYFDTGPNINGLPLLLPDESCIAEDEHVLFRFRCAREGFHLFGWGDVILYNVQAKVYLTNYRLIFVPLPSEKQKYNSFSICIEALEDPRLGTTAYPQPCHILEFDIHLDHGNLWGPRNPACKTVGELFDSGSTNTSPHHVYRTCLIACQFRRLPRATMFLKGIKALAIDGRVCPTRQCRFIEYEDLPVYCSVAAEPPAFDKLSVHDVSVH